MASQRQIQIAEQIAHLAGQFIARESNHTSLVTVTHADISPDLKHGAIYLSVLPPEMEQQALDFTKRNRSEFREYMRKHGKFRHLPVIDFEIDYGEKHRQKIDDLTRGM